MLLQIPLTLSRFEGAHSAPHNLDTCQELTHSESESAVPSRFANPDVTPNRAVAPCHLHVTESVQKKIHFPGLTELRALAAYAVVFAHIDQHGDRFGLTPIGLEGSGLASHAVTLFFVLSGFLITYLLAEEKRFKGNISIRKFYVRRILRIWPVYYLAVAGCLVYYLLTHPSSSTDFWVSLSLYFFLLPNLAYTLSLGLAGIIPLWSVGVEEQFYLVWPWVVRYSKSLLKVLSGIIVVYLATRIFLYEVRPTSGFYVLVSLTRIDCMAIGGLFSLIHTSDARRIQSWVTSRLAQILAIALLVLVPFTSLKLYAQLEFELIAICSGIWIYNCALNPHSIIRVGNPILRWLGTISYGVYVYHMAVIYCLGPWLRGQPSVVVHFAVVGGVSLVATISYQLMESPLLRLKHRFSEIRSAA